MSEIIPLFKSHYSLGRSILTLEKEGTSTPTYPDSIFDILKENQMKDLYLTEDGFSSFPEAYINSKESGINLKYGIRLTFTQNCKENTQESLDKEGKFILFARNSDGYSRLIKIFSAAATKHFYYVPRFDFEELKKYWNSDDLLLCVPFYDSFLFNNLLRLNQFVADFSFAKPVFFLENNYLPFDYIVRDAIDNYCKVNNFKTQEAQTILYKNKDDFAKYLAFRCINNRSKIAKPELEHMSSNSFCLEEWKNKCQKLSTLTSN